MVLGLKLLIVELYLLAWVGTWDIKSEDFY